MHQFDHTFHAYWYCFMVLSLQEALIMSILSSEKPLSDKLFFKSTKRLNEVFATEDEGCCLLTTVPTFSLQEVLMEDTLLTSAGLETRHALASKELLITYHFLAFLFKSSPKSCKSKKKEEKHKYCNLNYSNQMKMHY